MSAPSRPVADRPTTEPPQDATDTLRARVTLFPCDWCGRTVGCPCITSPMEVRRVRAAVTRRHNAAVVLARVSRRLDKRKAA